LFQIEAKVLEKLSISNFIEENSGNILWIRNFMFTLQALI